MITLQKIGDAIKFTFSGNTHYLQDGTVEVPVNSLSLTIDDSGMATFRKSASNDIFISATYGELGMSKDELVAWYKENMVDGGGSGITSGDVQNMIDESISGKADSSAVTEEISAAVSGKTNQNDNLFTIRTNVIDAVVITGGSGLRIIFAFDIIQNNQIVLSTDTVNDKSSLLSALATLGFDNKIYDIRGINYTDNTSKVSYYGEFLGHKCYAVLLSYVPDFDSITIGLKRNDVYYTLDAVSNGKYNYNYLDNKPAITTSVTSSSTDSEIPSAKAVYDALQESGGNNVVELTQAEYDALVSGGTVDPTAFYIITDAVAFDPSTKVDTSAFTAYSAATDTALSGKQDTLSAGTGIEISGNVISATGGGSITIDPSLDTSSTNPVANSAITTSVNEKQFKRRYVGCDDGDKVFLSTDDVVIDGKRVTIMEPMFRGWANNSTNTGLELQNVNLGLYFTTINGKNIFNTSKNGNWITEVIETSAITTSVTSSSTDAQVPSAKAVNDKLGGLSLVKLTQAEYDALATKDSNVLYVIVG